MKISQSCVGLSSGYMLEQEDTLQEKTSSKKTTTSILSSRRNRNGQLSKFDAGLPLVVVDRVSISGAAVGQTRTEYSHALSSQSSVSVTNKNETVDFSQQEVVKKLVSTVVKEQVSSLNLTTLGIAPQSRVTNPSSGHVSSAKTTISLDRTTSHFEQEQMTFASQGQVKTEDGRTISFSLDLAMNRATLTETREKALISTWQEEMALIDPLIINFEGGVPGLSDTRFEFDLDNDGTSEQISFAASGSGFLSFDKNNDGIINNGSELFGPGTGNGFDELEAYDLDGNGWIDESDDVFAKLSVWTRDETGNDLLISLKDAGLGAVYLGNAATGFELRDADNALAGEVARSGLFLFEDGNVGMIQQIDLAARSMQSQDLSESDNLSGLFQQVDTAQVDPAQVDPGRLEDVAPLPMEQTWRTENRTLLEDMRDQIREVEKQIRRLLNIESKPEKRVEKINRLSERIRVRGKGLTHRTGQAF